MARELNRGEIWLLHLPRPDKRRPAGYCRGVKGSSCANLCNLFTVDKRRLRTYVGSVGADKMRQVCPALLVASGCD